MMKRGYAFVEQSSGAAGNLNTYFADARNDPRILGQTLTREVHVTSTLRVPNSSGTAGPTSAGTWKIRWTETDLPLQAGVLTHTTAWEGYVTIRFHVPATPEGVQNNPLGLFITSITWTEISDSGGSTQ
jgi:type IV secretory pathway TrbF-like protein